MILIKSIATWILIIVLYSFLAWAFEQTTSRNNPGVKFLWTCCTVMICAGATVFPIWGIIEIWR